MNETFRFVVGLLILVSAGFAAGDVWQDWQDEQAMIEGARIRMNESIRHPDVVQRLIGLARVRDDVAGIYVNRNGIYSMIVNRAPLPIEQESRRAFDDNLQHCLTREKESCPVRLSLGLGQMIPNSWQRDLASVDMISLMLGQNMRDDAELAVNAIQDPMLQAYGYEQLALSWQALLRQQKAAAPEAAPDEDQVRRVRDFWQRAIDALENVPPGIDRLNSTAFLLSSLWQQEDASLKQPDVVRPLMAAAIAGMDDQPRELPTAIAWLQLVAAAAPYAFDDLNQQMIAGMDVVDLPEARTLRLQAAGIVLAGALANPAAPDALAVRRAGLVALTDPVERAFMLAIAAQNPPPGADAKAVAADLEQALEAARLIPDDQMLPELVVELTAAYAAQGFIDQANEMVGRLKPESDFYRDAVLEMGRYLVRAGKIDLAREWQGRLPADAVQAVRLGNLIETPALDRPGSDLDWRIGRLYFRSWMANAKGQEELWQGQGLYRQTEMFASEAGKLAEKTRDVAAPAAQGDERLAASLEGDRVALVDKVMAISDRRGPIVMTQALQNICPPAAAQGGPVDGLYLRAWVMRRLVLPALLPITP